MPRRTGPVTVDEFARLPDDDFRYELVAGVVHRMSPVGARHGHGHASPGCGLHSVGGTTSGPAQS